jgi:sigma-B regulation protein RsbU (phosphoserine phosphatase)
MTFFLAQVDAGVVTWVRAGNEPGLLLDPATGEITELVGDGMVLGIMPNEEIEELSVPFSSPGSVLAVVTDGITEAMDASEDMFGRDRLDTSLRKYAGCSAQGIVDGVLADVAAFRGDAVQNDDVTLAIVKRT